MGGSGNAIGHGSHDVDIVEESLDTSSSKAFTYYPSGKLETITTTKSNGDVYVKTFTWLANGAIDDISEVKA